MGEGEGGRILREYHQNMYYVLSYMKHITSPGSMHETGCSGLVHWDDPEGWGFRMGNTCTKEKKINIMSLGFIGLSYGEQSKLGLSNSFSFNISPSNEHPGLIFRMDWLDLLAVHGTLRSLFK